MKPRSASTLSLSLAVLTPSSAAPSSEEDEPARWRPPGAGEVGPRVGLGLGLLFRNVLMSAGRGGEDWEASRS